MREEAVLFGKTKSLVGIISEPMEITNSSPLPAVMILNAGLVHHVGPNRLYVKIARKLAGIGFTVLRFDFSGIGDSNVRGDHLPFQKSAINETQEAMDYLSTAKGVDRFILTGICSGAMAAFRIWSPTLIRWIPTMRHFTGAFCLSSVAECRTQPPG